MRRIVALAALALAGCAGLQRSIADPTKRDVGSECASSAECPATTNCVRGRCEYNGQLVSPSGTQAKTSPQKPCEQDGDCALDQLCIARFCEARDLAHQ